MLDDHVERKMILNENLCDSRTMSSLRFTVNKKNDTTDSHTGNVVIDIYGGRDVSCLTTVF